MEPNDVNQDKTAAEQTLVPNSLINADEDIIASFIPVPKRERHYQRIGFECATHPVEHQRLQMLNQKYEKITSQGQRVEQELNYMSAMDISRYELRIHELETLKESLKLKLITEKYELNELQQKRKEIEQKIKDQESELAEAYKMLADRKKNFTQLRLSQIHSELEQANRIYDQTLTARFQIEHDAHGKKENVFIERVDTLKKLQENTEYQLAILKEKVGQLNKKGIEFRTVGYMLYGGSLAAVAAGWFFSIFALSNDLSNNDFGSYFLSGIISALNELISNKPTNLIGAIAIYIAAIIALTILFIITSTFIYKKTKTEAQSRLLIEVSNNTFRNLYTQISANSLLSLWIQFMPLTLLFGCLFLLQLYQPDLSSTPQNDSLSKIGTSMGGQVTGTSLALASAVLCLIAITLILQIQNGHKTIKRLPIIIISALLILSIIIPFSGSKNPFNENALLSYAGFLLSVVVCSLSIGFGLYYRGILVNYNRIENQLQAISTAILNSSRSVPAGLLNETRKTFQKEYISIEKKIFQFIRGGQSKSAQELQQVNTNNTSTSGIIKSILQHLNPFSRGKSNEEINVAPILGNDDKIQFPDLTLVIEKVHLDLKNSQEKAIDLNHRIQSIITESTPESIEIKKQIISIEIKINNYRKATTNRKQILIDQLEHLWRQEAQFKYEMKYGFQLGEWYMTKNTIQSL